MKGVNKFIGIGNCVKDPEVKSLPNSGQVTTITIAINDSYKDKKTGQMVDQTEFVRVVFFGKLAEISGDYLRKGSKVYIEGKIKTHKWQDQSGQDKYSTEIVVDGFSGTLYMLDSKPATDQTGNLQQQNDNGYKPPNQQQPHGAQSVRQNQQPGGYQNNPEQAPSQQYNNDFDDSSIPF